MFKLEKVEIEEKKWVKNIKGIDIRCYFINKIDVFALHNTKKVEQILNIPDNYFLNDLLKITKEDLKEVDKELIKQLFKLVKEKVRRKFTFLEENEGYYSDDKKKNKKDSIFRKLYQEEKKRQE